MRAWHIVFWLLAGCSTVTTPPAQAILLTDPETGVFSADPPPASMTIAVIREPDKWTVNIADGPVPAAASPFVALQDPGGLSYGTVAHFETVGLTANNDRAFSGSTIPLALNGISGLALRLLIGRVNAWSRPPDRLTLPHLHPALSFMHGFLVATGGESLAGSDPRQMEMYDLALWTPVVAQPAFTRSPRSMAVFGTAALIIDETGATWVDLYDRTTQEATLTGFNFADVAGGDVINAGDAQYVVGATRATGSPTRSVLRVTPDRKLTPLTLNAARLGAAAATVRGQLYVAAGTSAESALETCHSEFVDVNCVAQPAGCDVPKGLPVGTTPATALYAADPTAGLAIVEGPVEPQPAASSGGSTGPCIPPSARMETSDASTATDMDAGDAATGAITQVALLVGGVDASTGQPSGIRSFDLNCATDCSLRTLQPLPPLSHTRAFPVGVKDPRKVLIVGEASDGEDQAFLFDFLKMNLTGPAALPFRERRRGATVALFPNGQVGVVGGTSVATGAPVSSVEIFVP